MDKQHKVMRSLLVFALLVASGKKVSVFFFFAFPNLFLLFEEKHYNN